MDFPIYQRTADGNERQLTVGTAFMDPEDPVPLSDYHTDYQKYFKATKARAIFGARIQTNGHLIYTDEIQDTKVADPWAFIPEHCNKQTMQQQCLHYSESYSVVRVLDIQGINMHSMDLSKTNEPKKGMVVVIAEKIKHECGRTGSKVIGTIALCFFVNMDQNYLYQSGRNLLPGFVKGMLSV